MTPEKKQQTVYGSSIGSMVDKSRNMHETTWESEDLEENLQSWRSTGANYHFKEVDPKIIIEKANEQAPDLPVSFIDHLIHRAKKRLATGSLDNINYVRIYDGGSQILLGLGINKDSKLIKIWFEPKPPFEIYHLSQ